jgi:hypothetical protein
VFDAAAPYVKEMLDLLLGREVFHQLRQHRRLRVFRGDEVIGNQRNPRWIEDARCALHAAHHADGYGSRELVCQHEVDRRVDDLARLDSLESAVTSEDFLGECHAHDNCIIRRNNGRNLR